MSDDIDAAHAETDYEVVETGNLSLPVSTAARFWLDADVTGRELEDTLNDHEYAFIGAYHRDGKVDSKVLDAETNEMFHIKYGGDTLRIYPKDDRFSKATLSRVVETVAEYVGPIEYVEGDS